MANDKNKRARKDSKDDEAKNKNPNWMNEPPYALSKECEGEKPSFTASCHCEDVTIDIYADKPKDAKFCHCDECQKMHGSAMHWSVALEKEKVHFKCDSDKLHFYRTSDKKTVHELPCKVSCNRCHSHLCDEGRNMMLMYPSTWNFKSPEDRHEFLPNKHIFYSFRAIDVHDGMDKWSKMPDESEKMDESSHHGQAGIVGQGSKEDK